MSCAVLYCAVRSISMSSFTQSLHTFLFHLCFPVILSFTTASFTSSILPISLSHVYPPLHSYPTTVLPSFFTSFLMFSTCAIFMCVSLHSLVSLSFTHPRAQYPSDPVKFTEKPLILHWGEGMQMLKDAGHEVCTVSNTIAYG